MRTLLPLTFYLLAALGLLIPYRVAASHIVGSDFSYTSLGNNRYRVRAVFYRDCSGIGLPTTLSLFTKQGGCTGLPGPTATMAVVANSNFIYSPYCTAVPAMCANSSPYTLYQSQAYEAVITLTPAPEWVLSVEDCCRPNTANTLGSSFRFEAKLFASVVLVNGTTQNIVNSTPLFSPSSLRGLSALQPNLLNWSAQDTDGDSLVYSLDRPLENCGVASNYKPNTAAGSGIFLIPSTSPPCYAQTSVLPGTFTPTLPMAVGFRDTTGSCPIRQVSNPLFEFDAASGAFAITPRAAVNTSPVNGDNKYVVVVKTSEYRRLSGAYYLVGTTRRDMMFTVVDCGSNQLPRIGPTVQVQRGTAVGSAQPLGQAIPVLTGESVSVLLTATDANPGQMLNWNLLNNSVPGVTMQAGTTLGSARLTFTPGAGTPSGLVRVAVTVEDNSCPLRGEQTKVLVFRVTGVLAARAAAKATDVAAWPSPFTDIVQFRLPIAGFATFTVADALGRVVATLRTDAAGVCRWQPALGLSHGLYLARTADGCTTVRLLYQPE